MTDDCFSLEPKHEAGDKTNTNVFVTDGLYFLSANTYGDDDNDDDDDGNDNIPDSKDSHSCFTSISLTQIGYTVSDERLNAACKTRNLSKSGWLPRDFSDR